MGLKKYLHNALVALDDFGNALTGGLPTETISSRSQRAADRGNRFGKFMVWWLDKIQSNHGVKAKQGDLRRAREIERIETDALEK